MEYIQREITDDHYKSNKNNLLQKRIKKRVLTKAGDLNVNIKDVQRRRRFLQEILTRLVNLRWRLLILVYGVCLVTTWFIFGCIWYLIAYSHGDISYFAEMKQAEDPKAFQSESNHVPCVTLVYSFIVAFLFSIETQTTIGFGHRYVSDECPEAIFTLCVHSIIGVSLNAFLVGVVLAKLSRPKQRAQTLLFSKNAIISQRDGVPCFMFRVADMRKNHIIEAHIRAQIIRKRLTKEGEFLPFYQQELDVGADGSDDKLMFVWPTTIVHKIDHNSPMYDLIIKDCSQEQFEIVVIIEGVVEATGNTTQATSSYMPSEILWGQQFEQTNQFKRDTGKYEVDYTKFDNTYPCNN